MSKLHPIYVALDGHQYSRAIKLASALPDSNILGKALLAHALSKSGQRFSALATLNKILPSQFYELRHEVQYSLQALLERQQSSSKTPLQPETPASSSKKGKKGKKKSSPVVRQQTVPSPSTNSESPKWDIVDQLDSAPFLPENWHIFPPAEQAITDETTLATLSVTLSTLKLPLTAYQMYAWAATAKSNEVILKKTFCMGLSVLATPSKWARESQTQIATHILAHLQAVTLQWARLAASEQPRDAFSSMLATAWASQSALWQLQWLPQDDKRDMILPRLAESMATRLMQQEVDQAARGRPSAEIRLLCLRTFEQQSKWSEMLDILEQLPMRSGDEQKAQESPARSSDFGVALTSYQILCEKARVLRQLKQYDAERAVYEDLLNASPDDWSCWKGHLECCVGGSKFELAKVLVEETLTKQAESKYPLRGPHLMKVELAAHVVRTNASGDALRDLQASIIVYSRLFAPHASCAFSDIEVYVELLLSTKLDSSKDSAVSLLDFAEKMRKANSSPGERMGLDNKELQSRLRAYIFTAKMNHKILALHEDLQKNWLPEWSELVSEWLATLSMSSSNEGEATQKEVKPGDDLVLLVVQQLLHQNPDDEGATAACAVLLETAIRHSSDNAYLKIAAVHVYYQLNAMSRSWEFFQAMGLKHIQLDSCVFTILPYLLEGGLYNETIEVCNALLRFQATTARDCSDYAGRAMEAGTLSKANEFMVFQRQKMNKSLAVVEAKGLILDAAALLASVVPQEKHDEDPILKGGIGIHQGIVGGDEDMGRATNMVVEVHNPYAALSIVSWADNGGSVKDSEDLADNRDLSILCHQSLYRSRASSRTSIVQDSLRRGHMHGVLIRSTLCLDAAKGPKKGKIVKSSESLEKRTESLLDCVNRTATFVKEHNRAQGSQELCCKALMNATLDLCRVLATITSGRPKRDIDDLGQREQHASDMLQTKALVNLKQAREDFSFMSVKGICWLLPNYVVPLFALFRMCATICNVYGWGKRKRNTKRCAGAMADFALELKAMIQDMLSGLKSLPSSESSSEFDIAIYDGFRKLLDDEMIRETTELLVQAQFRTRARVEPILQEMEEYLETFHVSDN